MAEQTESRITIGYALSSKKAESIITPSLLAHSKSRGIDFIPVNLHQPLLQQGPFHCLVHKIYDEIWTHQLLDFQSQNPNTPVVDPPAAIHRLHNRISMLDVVQHLKTTPSVGIPNQILLNKVEVRDEAKLGLRFPVIAKPVLANGSPNSHQMSLVFNTNGLKNVKEQQAEIVLQEFVNHGGVLYKVYVAGSHVRCVQRNSLPDFHGSDDPLIEEEGVMPFTQISNHQGNDIVIMPPLDFVNELASGLREATQLNLFNFDLIRDVSESSGGNRYLIIDINYFPGYAKLPGFEAMLTDFFLDVVGRRNEVGRS